MQFFKKSVLFFLTFTSFNCFTSEENSSKSYSESAYSWLQESNKNHSTFWKYVFLTSGMMCATGFVVSSLKTGLYLLYMLKEVLTRPGLMESHEEHEQHVLDKFYKMMGSFFAAGILFFGIGVSKTIPHNLKNNLPLFK